MKNNLVFKIGLIFLIILGAAIIAYPEEHKDASEFIYFSWGGGLSNISFEEVKILADGKTIVQIKINSKEKRTIEKIFQLDQKELDYFKTLIKNADFFNLPEVKTPQMIIDAGTTTLRISLDGKTREIIFQSCSELSEITSSLWKLANQGVILADLQEKNDAYHALGALSDHLASSKVFQPQTLREPLKEFVMKSSDSQQLLWAIEALSWVMNPEEWIGFLSAELDRQENTPKKILLLEVLSSHLLYSDIPPSHCDMLCPLFLKHLQLEYRNWSRLSKDEREAYGSTVRFLGMQHYILAVPTLVAMIDESYYDPSSSLSWSLPSMAGEIIDPMQLLLDNPKTHIRAAAVDTLGTILLFSPRPPTQEEKERIWNRLKKEIAPKLEKLAVEDPEDWVRVAAKRALGQIERGWNK